MSDSSAALPWRGRWRAGLRILLTPLTLLLAMLIVLLVDDGARRQPDHHRSLRARARDLAGLELG